MPRHLVLELDDESWRQVDLRGADALSIGYTLGDLDVQLRHQVVPA